MSTIWDAIEQPTLLLNEPVARRNIDRIVQKTAKLGIALRPHFKTHQSAEIGGWFHAAGVRAITVSSLDMAEYFADNGWSDILLALPVNPRQLRRISSLARRVRLGVLVESTDTVQALSSGLAAPADVWIKIDTGARRTGILSSDIHSAQVVAQALQGCNHLRLRGLLTHAGHTYRSAGPDVVCQRSAESLMQMEHLRQQLSARGIEPLEISIGDTPSASLGGDFGAADELRPGNFVFYDAQQMQLGACGWQDIAVALACPVVARHLDRDELVVYGGAIHLSKDSVQIDDKATYGYVSLPGNTGWNAPLPGAYVAALSQEHGILHVPAPYAKSIAVGDLVCLLPAHACLTVQAMQRYLTLTGRWINTLLCNKPALSNVSV